MRKTQKDLSVRIQKVNKDSIVQNEKQQLESSGYPKYKFNPIGYIETKVTFGNMSPIFGFILCLVLLVGCDKKNRPFSDMIRYPTSVSRSEYLSMEEKEKTDFKQAYIAFLNGTKKTNKTTADEVGGTCSCPDDGCSADCKGSIPYCDCGFGGFWQDCGCREKGEVAATMLYDIRVEEFVYLSRRLEGDLSLANFRNSGFPNADSVSLLIDSMFARTVNDSVTVSIPAFKLRIGEINPLVEDYNAELCKSGLGKTTNKGIFFPVWPLHF